jgi:predicted nucleotidyltransferase component of viral defense system
MKLDSNAYNALLPKTANVLKKMSEQSFLSAFTFVGGSALALYLKHRQSEDLDFFTWEDRLDKATIQHVIYSQFIDFKLINDATLQQDWIIEGVKVTFFANNWEALKDRQLFENQLFVADFDLLAAMKINTLFLRAKFRDYYDLYAIVKNKLTIKELFNVSQRYIPNLNQKLFEMALIYTEDIEDDNINYLSPIYKTTKNKISLFFQKNIAQR